MFSNGAFHGIQVSSAHQNFPWSARQFDRQGNVQCFDWRATLGHVLVQLHIGSTPLLARITERSRKALPLQEGSSV